MSADPDPTCPVLSPKLPTAEALAPYLRVIDGTRWYANRGWLTLSLETRLSALLGGVDAARGDPPCVATAASGTAALTAAILATAGRADAGRPLALMPSFTFVGTALAAEACGFAPHFVDIDPDSWVVEPTALAGHPALARAGVVVPVAACGRAVDVRGWERFRAATGVPVVVDAAASVEALARDPGQASETVPLAISLHATKPLSTGEGGCVLWRDPEGLARVVQATNFGFAGDRDCAAPSFNGKMSEYHAAVGLASLDAWEGWQAEMGAVTAAYAREEARLAAGRLRLAPEVASVYAFYEAADRPAREAAEAALRAARIGHRRWYGSGVHAQTRFRNAARDPLPATERLTDRLLGLPVWIELGAERVAEIVSAIAEREAARAARATAAAGLAWPPRSSGAR